MGTSGAGRERWLRTARSRAGAGVKYEIYKASTNLVVVQRVLRRRHVGWRVRGRKLPRERLDRISGRRHRRRHGVDVVLVAGVVAEVGRHGGGRGDLRAAAVGVGAADRRRRRRRRLHYRRLGVHRARARVMVLALPQLAADKADRDHGSIAADHFLALAVQLRERDQATTRKSLTAALGGTRVREFFQGTSVPGALSRETGGEHRRKSRDRDLALRSRLELVRNSKETILPRWRSDRTRDFSRADKLPRHQEDSPAVPGFPRVTRRDDIGGVYIVMCVLLKSPRASLEAKNLQRTRIRRAWVILSQSMTPSLSLSDDFALHAALNCHREISCLPLSLSFHETAVPPSSRTVLSLAWFSTDLRDLGVIFDLLYLRDFRVDSYVPQ